jgi:hypothetical protein
MTSALSHEEYLRLGGIINEKDYNSAVSRAAQTTTLNGYLVTQMTVMARFAGIKLVNHKNTPDPRTVMYGTLRHDTAPESVLHHHSNMSDQRLLAEVLRAFGDIDSLEKLVQAHPNISFS